MINYFNFAPQKHDSAALLKQNYTIDMFRYLILIKRPIKNSRFRPDEAENVLLLRWGSSKNAQDGDSEIT